MLLMPFDLLFYWLTGLTSLGLLGGGIYLLWAWYAGIVIGTGYLVAGILMTAFSFLGRPLMLVLLGRKPGREEPDATREGSSHRIPRPDGSEIFVETLGPPDAPTLIFTHGVSLDGTAWYYARRHLATRFRLVIWDVPGFGLSHGPQDGNYRMERLAEDLQAVIAFAGSQPVVLVGHSMGGMITLTLCRLFPQLLGREVTGLVLAHTTYTNPVRTAKFHTLLSGLQRPLLEPLCHLMILLSPLVRLMNWQSYLSGMAHLNVHASGFTGTETRGQLDFMARFTLRSSPASVGRSFLGMFRYDAAAALPAIPVPTVVVTGDQDIATLPQAGEYMDQLLPQSRRVALSPAGHLGMIERHAAFADALREAADTCFSEQSKLPSTPPESDARTSSAVGQPG